MADGRRAYALLLVAMAIWGVNLSAVKALTDSLDVLTVAAVRMVVATIALTVLLFLRRECLPALRGRDLLGLTACALFMVYGNQILFASGLSRTTATNGALIMSLGPLVSALLAALVFREALGARRLAGVAIGFAGVALVILNRPGAQLGNGSLGDLLILSSLVCFSSGGIAVQKLSKAFTVLQISVVIHVIGSVLLVLHAALSPTARLADLAEASTTTWSLILYSGVLATALAALVWNLSIARLGAARTAMGFYWVPIFGVGFAVVFLGEALTVWHAVGLGSVIVGSRLGFAPRQ
ncbi:MAG: EamA family transporter [Hydrogenophaga sp.]|uniref:DMT family transporter n=1 Tax=Hydrogenophaga sp. TaxID=1904254 RepID=UPI0016A1BC80|nr:DMT family transporter [Hydrogenophaga sp.]NIM40236.1 EamA family transporter [Hydrogenophaga sp.]NIN25467.1 EamA family transporter [Hydrogenophaga sp.]NIN30119.1 EamA family transporter [Hydrogenophaga sp.]NIN54420.1 EamA family transporter [Hydrogenophaga sp.]NIO50293.1 EamA family transporter [Hydrogenophaga sp.]